MRKINRELINRLNAVEQKRVKALPLLIVFLDYEVVRSDDVRRGTYEKVSSEKNQYTTFMAEYDDYPPFDTGENGGVDPLIITVELPWFNKNGVDKRYQAGDFDRCSGDKKEVFELMWSRGD